MQIREWIIFTIELYTPTQHITKTAEDPKRRAV